MYRNKPAATPAFWASEPPPGLDKRHGPRAVMICRCQSVSRRREQVGAIPVGKPQQRVLDRGMTDDAAIVQGMARANPALRQGATHEQAPLAIRSMTF